MKRGFIMYRKRNYLLVFVAILLIGCGGSGNLDEVNSQTKSPDSSAQNLPLAYSANEGRLLGAATCTQCHGTGGVSTNSWDSIAGEDELSEEFFEDEHPLMSAIAKGFSRDEVQKIGNWLSSMPKNENEEDED